VSVPRFPEVSMSFVYLPSPLPTEISSARRAPASSSPSTTPTIPRPSLAAPIVTLSSPSSPRRFPSLNHQPRTTTSPSCSPSSTPCNSPPNKTANFLHFCVFNDKVDGEATDQASTPARPPRQVNNIYKISLLSYHDESSLRLRLLLDRLGRRSPRINDHPKKDRDDGDEVEVPIRRNVLVQSHQDLEHVVLL
jgi:hypothetical protein